MTRNTLVCLLSAWLIFMLAACGSTQPVLTAAAIPAGWQPIQQPDVSLALPPAWKVVTSSDVDVQGALGAVATANPRLSSQLDQARSLFASGQMELIAYDLDPAQTSPGFTSNLSIGVVPAKGAALKDLSAANLAQLQATPAFSDTRETDTTVGGFPTAHFAYGIALQAPGGTPLPLQVDQYLWVTQDRQYLLTITTPTAQHEGLTATSKQILATVHVPGAK